MAESSLSIGFPELIGETGRFLGYGYKTYATYTASQQTELNGIVQSGIRRVYYPPALNAAIAGYEWSWLRPTRVLSIVSGDADYDLPDDFGRLIGEINFPSESYKNPIVIISVSKLLTLRSGGEQTGDPYFAAIRYKTTTGTTGQRQEILFFPEPDTARDLVYEYEAYNGAISSSYPYPLGGMQLAELYIESCLAVAESRITDEIGQHAQQFNALLVDAISRDKKRGSQYYGPMGQPIMETEEFKRGMTGSTYPITYHGETI